MFYTLASKLIIRTGTKRDYFYVFLAGSILYVMLHWYLNMSIEPHFTDYIKDYFYVLMLTDASIATALIYFFTEKKQKESNGENKEREELSDEQKRNLMMRMREAREQQFAQNKLREQMEAREKDNVEEKKETKEEAHDSIFVKTEELSSSTSTSSSSTKSSSTKKPAKKETKKETKKEIKKSKESKNTENEEKINDNGKDILCENNVCKVVPKSRSNDEMDTEIPVYK